MTRDTEWVSVGAVVQYVEDVLGRAHGLFAGAPHPGDPVDAGLLGSAAATTRTARRRALPLSGSLAARYGEFAADAGAAVDGLAGADGQLSQQLRDAAAAQGAGRHASGTVVRAAASDTALMSPLTGTPAGQRALVTALRDRVSQQQRVVAAYRIRDARMAALLGALSYPRAGGTSAGAPFGATGMGAPAGGFGTGGFGSAATGRPCGATAGGRTGRPVVAAAAWDRAGGGAVDAGPGGRAASAALGKRGRPYVWGAKGPNVFDCSGLTQWAWRQAGVQLGGDTYTQVRQGVPVSPDDVRAGDLIFPRSSFGEGGQAGPGHVMLAISATEVVHAPHSGDVVRVAPMPSRFLARRPVPASVA